MNTDAVFTEPTGRLTQGCLLGVALLVVLSGAAGCQPEDEWNRGAVSGKVTLDGQPLSTGQVTFFPLGPAGGPAAGAEIKDGQFALGQQDGPAVGKNRVEIRSVQKTGRMVKSPTAVEADGAAQQGMLVEEFADVVPKQYNTYSELEADITADKVNELNFELTKKPQTPRR